MSKICVATLKSIDCAYSQSKHYDTKKLNKESPEDYETRTWRERLHYDENGIVYMPGMSFKLAVENAAKYLSIKIPGKGKSTYSKHFTSGVLVLNNIVYTKTPIKKDEVRGERFYVPSNGERGGAKRVWKTFPAIDSWEVDVQFTILDDEITEDVFVRVLKEAGRFIGVGRFRPQVGGYYGRFEVVRHTWEDQREDE